MGLEGFWHNKYYQVSVNVTILETYLKSVNSSSTVGQSVNDNAKRNIYMKQRVKKRKRDMEKSVIRRNGEREM